MCAVALGVCVFLHIVCTAYILQVGNSVTEITNVSSKVHYHLPSFLFVLLSLYTKYILKSN